MDVRVLRERSGYTHTVFTVTEIQVLGSYVPRNPNFTSGPEARVAAMVLGVYSMRSLLASKN